MANPTSAGPPRQVDKAPTEPTMSASEKPLRHQGDSLNQPSDVDYRKHNLSGVPSVYFESPHAGRQTIGAIAIFAFAGRVCAVGLCWRDSQADLRIRHCARRWFCVLRSIVFLLGCSSSTERKLKLFVS